MLLFRSWNAKGGMSVSPVLEHAIAKVQGNPNDSNVNGTHHLLVYTYDATLPG